jgi:beta-1,4-mannosyltransferase
LNKIGFYPGTAWHAYQKLLAEALEKGGYEVVQGDDFSDKALCKTDQTILHFHWIERLWDGPSYLGRIKCLIGVWGYLRKAKRLNKTIVWTVHNHEPHQAPSVLDKIGVRMFCWYADVIACHSHWSKNWIMKASVNTVSPIVVYHGNFKGVFHGVEDNRSLKQREGLATNKLCVGMIGEIRPNRGHELAIRLVNQLDDVQLLIAGRIKDTIYLDALIKMVAQDKRQNVIFKVGNLSNQEYNDYSACSDVCLLPYHSITTSGALMSAWTIGTPVIASDLDYFKEMIPSVSQTDAIFSLNDEDNLLEIVCSYKQRNWLKLRQDTLMKAASYDWDIVVQPMLKHLKK